MYHEGLQQVGVVLCYKVAALLFFGYERSFVIFILDKARLVARCITLSLRARLLFCFRILILRVRVDQRMSDKAEHMHQPERVHDRKVRLRFRVSRQVPLVLLDEDADEGHRAQDEVEREPS